MKERTQYRFHKIFYGIELSFILSFRIYRRRIEILSFQRNFNLFFLLENLTEFSRVEKSSNMNCLISSGKVEKGKIKEEREKNRKEKRINIEIEKIKSPYYLGQEIENESIYREYKEFTVGYGFLDKIDRKKIEEYIQGNFDNEILLEIEEGIPLQIEKYLLKYVTSFINIHTCDKTAILLFGVNDQCIITGIPVIADNIENIQSNISFTLEKNLSNIYYFDEEKFTDVRISEDILNRIKESISVDIHILPMDKYDVDYFRNTRKYEIDRLSIYEEKIKEWNLSYDIYLQEYTIWNRTMNKYSCKLVEIFEDEERKRNFTLYVNDNQQYRNLIVENSEEFDIRVKYEVQGMTYDMKFLEADYIFLIKEFKDAMRTRLVKPKLLYPKPFDPSRNIVHKISPITQCILEKENFAEEEKENRKEKIVYILLEIKIRLEKFPHLLGFINGDSLDFRVRKIGFNGPESSGGR